MMHTQSSWITMTEPKMPLLKRSELSNSSHRLACERHFSGAFNEVVSGSYDSANSLVNIAIERMPECRAEDIWTSAWF